MNDETEQAVAPVKPLFYQEPEVLEASRHKGLGLSKDQNFAFTAEANAIPLNAAEFAKAAVWYPIVFAGRDKLAPIAVVGVRQGENLFVDGDGAWTAGAYLPAYVRRHPFILTRPDESKEQVLLCIDRASSRVVEDAESPFFDGEEASEHTKNALEFCVSFQRHALATERAVQALKDADILSPQQGKIELGGGEVLQFTDFHVVDEKKFNELGDDAFMELRKSGALNVAYCQMVSMNCWPRLAQMAASRKQS